MGNRQLDHRLPPDLPTIPPDWKWRALAQFVPANRSISYGIVQPGAPAPGGVPVLRVDNVDNGRVLTRDVLHVAADIEKAYARSRLRGGEILMTLVGAYFGKVAVAPPCVAGYNTARAVGVVPVNDAGRFLMYALRSPVCQHYIQTWATTTAQPTLNLSDVARIPVPWPPPRERAFIGEALGALDDKIELNRRMNETLEAMARALFRSWFVDFDPVRAKAEGRRPAGMDAETAALFPDGFEDSPLGKIPRGWTVGLTSDVARAVRRMADPGKVPSETPYIGLEHMPRKSIALSDWGDAATVAGAKSGFRVGEILFGKLRPYFHKVGVAPVDGVCSTDILVLSPREEHWFAYVLGQVSSDEFVAHTDATSTGTKMPRTNWQDMGRFAVVLPPAPVAGAFDADIRPAISKILCNIHESRTLAGLRDTLLPKLLSGEIRVPEAKQLVETHSWR